MPIDPQIPLMGRPAPIENPLAVMQQGNNMQALQAETALRQQQTQQSAATTQGEQLRNQQAQLDLQDQKTIRQAYMDAAGDMDKFQDLVRTRGVSPKNLMAVNSSLLEMKQKQATLSEAQNKIQAAHGAALATEAANLLAIPDPQQRAIAAADSVQRLQAGGFIDSATAGQLNQHIQSNGITDDDLKLMQAHGLAAARLDPAQVQALARTEQADAAKANSQRTAQEFALKQPVDQEAADQAVRASWSNRLAAAAQAGPTQYQALRATAPTSIGDVTPATVHDAQGKVIPGQLDKINNLGMTAQQRTQEAGRVATEARQTAQEASTDAYRNSQLDLERQRLEVERNRANRAQTADERQAYSEIQKLQSQEDAANKIRMRLGSAMQGTSYIPDTGLSKPFADMTPQQQQEARQDMKNRYDAATDSLVNTILPAKYQQYARLGVTQPGVSLADAQNALRNPQGANPPPARQTGQQPPSSLTGQPSQAAPAKPPASSSNAPKKSYTVNGTTYTEGQTIYRGGKPYTFRSFQNGKIQADPQ